MEHDTKVKRARFIGDSTNIRETFSFANPPEILKAVRLYCGHYYGAMLWDFQSEMTGQFCRSWNTCVKLAYNIPRSTHTYLVENDLSSQFIPVKKEIMARFFKFYQSLIECKSIEISVLAKIVISDVRSVTARNMELISKETKSHFMYLTAIKVRNLVPVEAVPVNHEWRGPLLMKLLTERRQMEEMMTKTDVISSMIDSLCSS